MTVPLMRKKLHTISEYMSSPPGFRGVCVAQSLVFCVVFGEQVLGFCFGLFSFCQCIDRRLVITPLAYSNFSYLCSNMVQSSYFYLLCCIRHYTCLIIRYNKVYTSLFLVCFNHFCIWVVFL